MSDVLATAGLTKRYGGLMANDGVAMALAAGEIRGLIGPNGAGKTTFVNLVTGIERPDEGEILLDGSAITGLGPHRVAARGLVRSFQVARVFGNLTVRENLMVPYFASARTRGTAEAIARIGGTFAALHIGAARRRPRKIALRWPTHAAAGLRGIHDSGCESSRARRAVRWHQSGREGHIDRSDLKENRAGATFLIVSHEMEVIRRICPRVTVMIAGKVAAEGPLEDIARREDVVTAYLGRSLQ